ncbi:glutaminase GtaA [Cordyceps fumosorosea ARSEF 2679]|uniref:Glutaminase GtaA n=1 Tax=Cordyceps fumosorosea (strain ARSEF 2679) TaxID=1081104 RepID=A0A167PPU1_CORFA|nr:glutaminase GtaA [Cordyceps fumosorosea ARSEF 2679]OAA56899.1 glutaminase GtaA [Cordyceps fumosorosea ARSEF 2679]
MKFWQVATAALLAGFGQVDAKSTFSPARPPAAPLAVRSPYLNVWLNGRTDGGESGILPNQWPRFWTEGVQGWQGFIKVDGKTYNWMGNHPSPDFADQTAQSYTSTKTEFVMNVGSKVELTVSFLSPVFPTDHMRQSIPFAYMNLEVKSIDGRPHSVQVYSDVSGGKRCIEFASGDSSAVIQWEHQNTNGLHSHHFWRVNQDVFNEANDQASWGHWYWTTKDQRGVSYQIGQDTAVRSQFMNNGYLDGSIDTQFRAVHDRWPVFALSRDLGKVSGSVTTLFTIGIAQDEGIQYHGVGDQKGLPSLWKDYFNNDTDLVKFFYDDYGYSLEQCLQLDHRIAADSKSAAGQDYATITSLALRQFYGAIQLVGTKNNIKVFMKEISSDSDIQTVDVLFPAFPAMVYLNPNLIKWSLEPLLEYQKSGRYPNKWAVHDLGRYPRALGYDSGNDEPMPLEECGNMIIMMLSYAQKSGDNKWLADNWDLLTRWAEYLIQDARIPAHQLSTDDFAGQLANQTNLAIKGIIALEAMSEIATRAGQGDQKQRYSDVAHEYYDFWSAHGINRNASRPHSTLAYDDMDSYGLLYNLWGDKVLRLGFVPEEVYAMQSAWYPRVANEYGMVLDTRGTLTKTDWEIFAASTAEEATKMEFVRLIAKWINETKTWRALTDLYDTKDGGYPRGIEFTARPVVGGLFAILALQ